MSVGYYIVANQESTMLIWINSTRFRDSELLQIQPLSLGCSKSDIGSNPKISDRGNCDPNPIRNFRISELFGSDHRISDRVRWIFWKISIRIRSENPEFFPGTRSEISEILKSDRIFEISDRIGGFSDRIFLHTPNYHLITWVVN